MTAAAFVYCAFITASAAARRKTGTTLMLTTLAMRRWAASGQRARTASCSACTWSTEFWSWKTRSRAALSSLLRRTVRPEPIACKVKSGASAPGVNFGVIIVPISCDG